MTSYRVWFEGVEQPAIINSALFESHWIGSGMYYAWWKNFRHLKVRAIEKLELSIASVVHEGRKK